MGNDSCMSLCMSCPLYQNVMRWGNSKLFHKGDTNGKIKSFKTFNKVSRVLKPIELKCFIQRSHYKTFQIKVIGKYKELI